MGVNAHNVDIRRLPGHSPPLSQYQIYSSGAQFYIWHNRLLNRSLIQYPFKVSSTALLRDHIESYIWRHNHQVLVSTLYFKQQVQQDKYSIFYERVLTNLSRIKDLCFQDSLEFYYAGLKGFQLLWQKYGYFQIKQQMFHVTEQGKAKVWCDRNISKIFPTAQNGTQQMMVSQIARVLQSNTDQAKCKIHVGSELRKQSCDTFDKAISHFVSLCRKANYELSSKLNCMYTIYMGGVENIVDQFGPTQHPLKDRYIKNPQEQTNKNAKSNLVFKQQNLPAFPTPSSIKIDSSIHHSIQKIAQPIMQNTNSVPKPNYLNRSQSMQILQRSRAINTNQVYQVPKPQPFIPHHSVHAPGHTSFRAQRITQRNTSNTPTKIQKYHNTINSITQIKPAISQSLSNIRIPSNASIQTPRQSITPIHISSNNNKNEQARRASLSPGLKFNYVNTNNNNNNNNNNRNIKASRYINTSQNKNIHKNYNNIPRAQTTQVQNINTNTNNAGQTSHRYFPLNSTTSIKMEPTSRQQNSSRVHKISKLQLKTNFEHKNNQYNNIQPISQTKINTNITADTNTNTKTNNNNNMNTNKNINTNINNITNTNTNTSMNSYNNTFTNINNTSINQSTNRNYNFNNSISINNISNPSLQFSLGNIQTPKQSKQNNFSSENLAQSKFAHRNPQNNQYTFKIKDNNSENQAITNFKSSPVIHKLKFKTRQESNQSKLDQRVNNFSAILQKLKQKYCTNMNMEQSSSNFSKLVSPTQTYTKRVNQQNKPITSQQFINVFSHTDNTLLQKTHQIIPADTSFRPAQIIQKPVQYTISVHVQQNIVKQSQTYTILHNNSNDTNNIGTDNKKDKNESMTNNSRNKKKYIPDIDEDIWKDMLRLKNKSSPTKI